MTAKRWSKSKKTILLGGAIGVAICALLFLFYQFVYFPAFSTVDNDTDPSWLMIPPLVTGHIFPMSSHFIVEGSPAVSVFCKATNPECTLEVSELWLEENKKGCDKPLVSENPDTGEKMTGCCMQQIMVPDESCTKKVEIAGFIVVTAFLALVYFALGALVAWRMQKNK